ncbi:MAG: hypothetical protein K2H09_07215, partial [Treponemataceae bacterium]|nr:hypothetical protein [Treponemataceae bacterium]
LCLSSIHVRIRGVVHDVPVPPLEVRKNLEEVLPELIVTLADGREFGASADAAAPVLTVAAGTPVLFAVSVRYAARLLSFSWTAPRAALLEEVERHEPAEWRAASDEAAPVAEFSWTPLEAGVQLFPAMRLEALSFGGIRADAAAPEISVLVLPGSAAAGAGGAAESQSDAFSGAFLRQEIPAPAVAAAGASMEECVRLAGLRRTERRSLPFGAARREREALERGLGFSGEPAEPTVFAFVLFLALAAVFLLAAAVALLRRRAVWLCAAGAAAMAVCAAVSGVRLRTPYGIFCGGTVAAVPEADAAASAAVEPGRHVRIVRRAGGWVLLRAGSSSGWTAAERILEI